MTSAGTGSGISAERLLGTVGVAHRPVDAGESRRASRGWWDADADDYHAEHGADLGEADFVWCPEMLREDDAHLLGDPAALAGARVLEVGCGGASCARWLRLHGAKAIGLDLSAGMLRHARTAGQRSGCVVPLVQADAAELPFADGAFDLACSAFGAVAFSAVPERIMSEVARVLRPGGHWVFSAMHPMRWMFSDDPTEAGLTVTQPYFDRSPYVEVDANGRATYVEHHRTMADRIPDIVAAGLVVERLVEPAWPDGLTRTWGQWSPLRGALFPGTAIFCCAKPATT